MIGHCFLSGGCAFPGLIAAITHVLCGGSIDTATVTVEDCPDLEIREILLLFGHPFTLTAMLSSCLPSYLSQVDRKF